ncbi:2OG-Fe(II) oxygenase superfamily domain-containing protein [Trichoderma breve]|uniref:2OG-Fe(II) oxygenase superfamily domain-containing protein n=1 Tax=Trichoderma breve TaxID=2034170 RepID=A0A9W9E7J2_9HYPO|nr:2OG-Fe(II) oxygenase superfamily domain-containing protein [Trichoderma breve]KAJ4859447.1 2OG-Fe(II) oxygenase superfamily domain-containing protein [Trichoderma breve]
MFERLDFSNFYSTNTAEREGFCRQLVSSLKQFGFARLANIGIPPSDIDGAFETSREFFQLPLDQKLKSPHPPTATPHRGYSAFGIENVSAVSNHGTSVPRPLLKDMKESYDIGSPQDALYGNIWPPPGVHDAFQPTFTSFFSSCYRAELAILEAISVGLGLPRQTLSQLHSEQSNELRLTHYPAVPRGEFSHSTRIAAHTDFGTITLLFQDDVGGLQMELPSGSGEFVDIESGGRYECILNVGDCLQMWTGLCSARHRVHLPSLLAQEDQTGPMQDTVAERFSIAYFAKPNRAASLRPLLHDTAKAKDVSFMTAGEFQHMRISGTY